MEGPRQDKRYISGTTWEVYLCILTSREPVGVRDIWREEIRKAAGDFTTILGVASKKTQKVTIAADVHTDTNIPPRVLEEALGKFNVLITVYSDADGNLYASAGPAYNYFEFKWPIAERLTDEAWTELLSTSPPQPPDWTSVFTA